MSFIHEYETAFRQRYQQAKVNVITVRGREGRPGYKVSVNGDHGDLVLSEFDLRVATRAFRNGAARRDYPRATAKLGDIAKFKQ